VHQQPCDVFTKRINGRTHTIAYTTGLLEKTDARGNLEPVPSIVDLEKVHSFHLTTDVRIAKSVFALLPSGLMTTGDLPHFLMALPIAGAIFLECVKFFDKKGEFTELQDLDVAVASTVKVDSRVILYLVRVYIIFSASPELIAAIEAEYQQDGQPIRVGFYIIFANKHCFSAIIHNF
jgi:hypothetical protein